MIIFNWDVIAEPGIEQGSRRPNADGMRLWNMFHQTNRGRVGLVISEDKINRDIFESWLYREGIKASFYETIGTNPELQQEKVHRLVTLHGRADWYIDSNVDLCTRLVRLGVPSLVYANPPIIRPEWNTGPQRKPWAQLQEELHAQAEKTNRVQWDEPIDVDGEV